MVCKVCKLYKHYSLCLSNNYLKSANVQTALVPSGRSARATRSRARSAEGRKERERPVKTEVATNPVEKGLHVHEVAIENSIAVSF